VLLMPMLLCNIALLLFQILVPVAMAFSLLDGHSLTTRRMFQTLNGLCGPHFCMHQLHGFVSILWSLRLFGMLSRR
jgi:ABC-type polysaccharide transport system permease subunit